jgi:hypothetical protein
MPLKKIGKEQRSQPKDFGRKEIRHRQKLI